MYDKCIILLWNILGAQNESERKSKLGHERRTRPEFAASSVGRRVLNQVVHFENERLSGAPTVVVAVVVEPDSTLTFFQKKHFVQ